MICPSSNMQGQIKKATLQAETLQWEGAQAGQLTCNEEKDIPFCMKFCSAIKAQRKEKEGDHLWL